MYASTPFVEMARELLARGCRVRFRADGRSMLPAIQPGDILVVEPIELDRVRTGDVLLYAGESGPIAHRVVRIRRRGTEVTFILRGDATLEADAPVEADQVLGRAASVEAPGGERSLLGFRSRAAGLLRAHLLPLRARAGRLRRPHR